MASSSTTASNKPTDFDTPYDEDTKIRSNASVGISRPAEQRRHVAGTEVGVGHDHHPPAGFRLLAHERQQFAVGDERVRLGGELGGGQPGEQRRIVGVPAQADHQLLGDLGQRHLRRPELLDRSQPGRLLRPAPSRRELHARDRPAA